jgi:hypothetical protein
VAATGAAAVLLVGCAPDRSDEATPTTTSTFLIAPPTSGAPRSTLPPPPPQPDTRGVELPVLTGPAPTVVGEPLEIYGGDAELSGSLGYGGEPVEGATVRLERWVDGTSTFVELTTGPGGGWLARDIHGGRYVIRAWKGSRLVLEQASAVFIADDEERAVHLAMAEVYVPEPEDDEDEDSDEDEDEDSEDEDSGDEDEDGGEDEDSGEDEDTDTTAADEEDER